MYVSTARSDFCTENLQTLRIPKAKACRVRELRSISRHQGSIPSSLAAHEATPFQDVSGENRPFESRVC